MAPPLYGLDIETDTAQGGLDPARAAVVAVAISHPDGDTVLTGSEPALLTALDEHLASLEPGVIVTWNGAAFDLPFLAQRASSVGARLDLTLLWDASVPNPHDPLPGHPGRYRAVWHQHRHLDAYRAYRASSPPGVSCGLKQTARREGLSAVEVDDISALHTVPVSEMRRYVASDASLARRLALIRWADVKPFVDPIDPGCRPALFHLAATAP